MPLMYLAKVNVNATIFKVYEKKLDLNVILNDVFSKMDSNVFIESSKNEKYNDSYGNTKYYENKSTYQFSELDKNAFDRVITGKIVRTFRKPTEEIVGDGKKVVSRFQYESVSIYFYFDVKSELITFSERQSFGYNQFVNAFKGLLNKYLPEYGFEIFLQKDSNKLDEKINSLKCVNRIIATLIPPNANEEEMEEFRKLPYSMECEESNASKYRLELTSAMNESLNMQANRIKDITKAVSKGYGEMTAIGINVNNKEQVIRSNQDAACTRVINNNLDKGEFNEESRSFISLFLRNMIRQLVKE